MSLHESDFDDYHDENKHLAGFFLIIYIILTEDRLLLAPLLVLLFDTETLAGISNGI